VAPDPIKRFQRWFAEARKAGIALPEATALATVDRRGRPTLRYVLLKGAGPEGFVFYTNTSSPKGRQLEANPYAALAFYWDPIGRQVRVDGRTSLVGDEEADAYWKDRPRDSQLASLASRQSAPITSRGELLTAYRALRRKYEGREVPRPRHWTGYTIDPDRIEFWTRKEPRLHHRELFVRKRGGWERRILQP
jgi:pyridoxamine 5'-phosphate oxidase